MNKFFETILIGIAGVFITIFLPKQIVGAIRELLKFVANSIVKYWYVAILIFGCFFLINQLTQYFYLGEFTSKKFILVSSLISAIAVAFLSFFRELISATKFRGIAFYGCFSVKENEYLAKDVDSEHLDIKLEAFIHDVYKSVFTYRNSLIELKLFSIPRFVPIILGHKGLNKYISGRVGVNKNLAGIYFIHDVNNLKLTPVICYSKDEFLNSEPMLIIEKLLGKISESPTINASKTVELSVKIILLLFAQCVIDHCIEYNKLQDVHYILDDTEKLISEVKRDSSNLPEPQRNDIAEFLNFWTGYVERYKALLLIEEKQYYGAVGRILKSININPYYPYDNYQSLKQDYTKKYGIQLASTITGLEEKSDEETNARVINDLITQVSFQETSYNYDVVKSILFNDDSGKSVDLIVEELRNLRRDDPFILLTASEIIRYAKKGTEKLNEIYVARFDEAIDFLKDAIKLDNDFPVLYTKLGMLIMLKGMYYDNMKLKEEGAKQFEKGMHFFSEVGFNNVRKAP